LLFSCLKYRGRIPAISFSRVSAARRAERLRNCVRIGKDFGNLAHGYCLTSHTSQSKGVDCVFVAESSASFRAADREQFYVSVSRFKESLTVYTDDKHELLEAVRKSSKRPSAMDLLTKDISKSAGEAAANKPSPASVIENEQNETSQIQRLAWPPRMGNRKSQSRGISI
jgi:hypothetical protein